ncbi:MAG: hypothetical protein AABZ11_00050 [Nitrospinota bacterium]
MTKRIIVLIAIFFIYELVYAQDEIMKEDQFDFNKSLYALDSIRQSLNTFRDITEIVFTDEILDKLLSEKDYVEFKIEPNKFKNIIKEELKWSKQNIANPNAILQIKGTLLKMEMEINRLSYENTLLKKGEMNQNNFKERKQKYNQSKEAFKEFIKTHHWYD